MAEEVKKEAVKGDYAFAANKLKLQRAIGEVTAENSGKVPADEVVKERYIKLGGLLIAEEEAKTAAPRKIMAPKSTLAEAVKRRLNP